MPRLVGATRAVGGSETYTFGDFEIDRTLFELSRRGVQVEVEPKVFDLLSYIVAHRDRVIPKDELFAQLWPNEFVTDSALTYCIRAARKALGDNGSRQRFIQTLRGRGYRFVAEVSAARDQGPGAMAESPVTSHQSRPVFVGREREMGELKAALGETISGRGRVVLLLGEPGTGKTRTADELAAIARQRGATVLVGRCYEGEGAPAFWPWVQVARAYVRDRDATTIRAAMGAGASAIAHIVSEVAERLTDIPQPPALEPEQARFRLFDSYTTFLRSAAAREPLVVLVDDLHWADPPSLRLLQFLAREIGNARLLVIATCRDAEPGTSAALSESLAELGRLHHCRRISLGGLSEPEVARFIGETGGVEPTNALVAAVYGETEGNPFFVTEIVRLLVAEGGANHSTTRARVAVPQTVREAIARRIQRLCAACQEVLHLAAVVGREFDIAVLQRARGSRTPANELLPLLDEAASARVLEPVPQAAARAVGRYRFAHALVRETLHAALPAAERARLHLQVGQAIEALQRRDLEPHVTTLAYHFLQAMPLGAQAKALRYAMRAGERAAQQLAYEAAVAHFEAALQVLASGPGAERRRCEVLVALGDNQWKSGDVPQAKESFREAAAIARRLRLWEWFARAALGYGDALRGFEIGVLDPVLTELLEEALHQLGATDSDLRVRVLARLAIALYPAPNSLPRRDALSQNAVDLAQRLGDHAAQITALYSRHWAIWGPERLDERLQAATRMLRLATAARDREMQFHAHRFRFMDLLEAGAMQEASDAQAACTRLAGELRQPYYLWYVRSFEALRAFLDGCFDVSERLSQEALAIGQRAHNENVTRIFAMQMFGLRREQGRMAELEDVARAFIAQYPTLPAWRAALAVICREVDKQAEARAAVESLAADDFAALPRDTFWLAAIAGLADVCADLGDVQRAAVLYNLLAPYAERNVMMTPGTACSGAAARPLARVAASLQRWNDALRHFEAALDLNGRLGARHFVAHTQAQYAEMLLQRGHPGDARRAVGLLDAARATYDALGMTQRRDGAATARQQAETLRARPHTRVTALRQR